MAAKETPVEVANRIFDTSRAPKPDIVYVRPGGWMKLLVFLCIAVSCISLVSLQYMTGNRKVGNDNGDKLDSITRIACQTYTDQFPTRPLPADCATGKK